MEDFYVYVFLDPRKPGQFVYPEYFLGYEPFYVGMGSKNRINGSLTPTGNKRNILKKRKIKKIKDSGHDVIKIKIKTGLSRGEACELEMLLIKTIGKIYDKTGPLTNITDGGDSSKPHSKEWRKVLSKPVLQYARSGEFIAEYPSIKEACRVTSLIPQNVGAAVNGKYRSSGGFVWKYKNPEDELQGHLKMPMTMPKHSEATKAKMRGRKKSDVTKRKMSRNSSVSLGVIKVDEQGNYIKEWCSITEAAKELNLHLNKIRRSCDGRSPRIEHKFIWSDPHLRLRAIGIKQSVEMGKRTRWLAVSQIKDGDVVKTWDCVAHVVTGGFSKAAVHKCCRNGRPHKGFHWKFKETTQQDAV